MASLVGERELIRLACCSRRLRTGLLSLPFLWSRSLTLELSNPGLVEQIQTLFLDRALSHRSPSSYPSTTGAINRWLLAHKGVVHRPLSRLALRLAPPSVTVDEHSNRLIIVPDQSYWNMALVSHNLRAIRGLLTSSGGSGGGLEQLDIRLEGQFEPTLAAAHEAWSLIQTPWARTLENYRVCHHPTALCCLDNFPPLAPTLPIYDSAPHKLSHQSLALSC